MSVNGLPDLLKKWWPIVALIAAAAGWIYRVDAHITDSDRRMAETNQALYQIRTQAETTRATGWALLWWATQISRQNGWVEPPSIIGAEKPSKVVIPPKSVPADPWSAYAAEVETVP